MVLYALEMYGMEWYGMVWYGSCCTNIISNHIHICENNLKIGYFVLIDRELPLMANDSSSVSQLNCKFV